MANGHLELDIDVLHEIPRWLCAVLLCLPPVACACDCASARMPVCMMCVVR